MTTDILARAKQLEKEIMDCKNKIYSLSTYEGSSQIEIAQNHPDRIPNLRIMSSKNTTTDDLVQTQVTFVLQTAKLSLLAVFQQELERLEKELSEL